MPYGTLVEVISGKDDLLHIFEIGWKRLETVEQAGLKEGDTVSVKLIDINPKTGKFKISGKELLPKRKVTKNIHRDRKEVISDLAGSTEIKLNLYMSIYNES